MFAALNDDCLDAIATQLLGDLVESPLHSLRSFLALCRTSRWRPSKSVYEPIWEAFRCSSCQNSRFNVRFWLSQVQKDNLDNENWPFSLTTSPDRAFPSCVYKLLNTIDQFSNPLAQLPTSKDEWSQCYLFFTQTTRTRFSDFEGWQCVGQQIKSAAILCQLLLGDLTKDHLRYCAKVCSLFLRSESVEAGRIFNENCFLASRCGCSVLQLDIRHWRDALVLSNHSRGPSKFLIELLKNDEHFLSSFNSEGFPNVHTLLLAGVHCDETISYVAARVDFRRVKPSILEKNSLLHSIAHFKLQSPISTMSFVVCLRAVFKAKKSMLKKIYAQNHPYWEMFSGLDVMDEQPWQACRHSRQSLLNLLDDDSGLSPQARVEVNATLDLLDEVQYLLRVATIH